MLRNRSRDASFLCYHSVAPAGPPGSRSPRAVRSRSSTSSTRGATSPAASPSYASSRRSATRPPDRLPTFDDGFLDNYETVAPTPPRARPSRVRLRPAAAGRRRGAAGLARGRRRPGAAPGVDALGHLGDAGGDAARRASRSAATASPTPTCRGSAAEALREELADSRRRIEARLGSCPTLAYPFGEWSPMVARRRGMWLRVRLHPADEDRAAARDPVVDPAGQHRLCATAARRFAAKLSTAGPARLPLDRVPGAARRQAPARREARGSVGAASGEDDGDRRQQDLDVAGQRPAADVLVVEARPSPGRAGRSGRRPARGR